MYILCKQCGKPLKIKSVVYRSDDEEYFCSPKCAANYLSPPIRCTQDLLLRNDTTCDVCDKELDFNSVYHNPNSFECFCSLKCASEIGYQFFKTRLTAEKIEGSLNEVIEE